VRRICSKITCRGHDPRNTVYFSPPSDLLHASTTRGGIVENAHEALPARKILAGRRECKDVDPLTTGAIRIANVSSVSGGGTSANLPITFITYSNAARFVNWLSFLPVSISRWRAWKRDGNRVLSQRGQSGRGDGIYPTGLMVVVRADPRPPAGSLYAGRVTPPSFHELSDPAQFRYLRNRGPNGSHGNVAEIEFYRNGVKVTGTGFGTPGSWSNSGSTFDKALDGDVNTFFDAPNADGNYVGVDDTEALPFQTDRIRYYPREGFENGTRRGEVDRSRFWNALLLLLRSPAFPITEKPTLAGRPSSSITSMERCPRSICVVFNSPRVSNRRCTTRSRPTRVVSATQ
jgi:hypothetical protein